jgi:hypothetical protein
LRRDDLAAKRDLSCNGDLMSHDEFEKAAQERQVGLVSEFLEFLRDDKKWWLLPIVFVLLLFGGLVLLSGTAAAPFIYTLF